MSIVAVNPDIPKDWKAGALSPPAKKLGGAGDKGQVFASQGEALKAAQGIPGAVVVSNPGKPPTFAVWVDAKLEVYQRDRFQKSQPAAAAGKVYEVAPVVIEFDFKAEYDAKFKSTASEIESFSTSWMSEVTDPNGFWASAGKAVVDGMAGESDDKFIKDARKEVGDLLKAAKDAYAKGDYQKAYTLLGKAESRMKDYQGASGKLIDDLDKKGEVVTKEIKEKTELAIELIACLAGPGAAAKGPTYAAKLVKVFGSSEKALAFIGSKFGQEAAKKVATMVFGMAAGAVAGGTAEAAKATGEGKSATEVAKATGAGAKHGAAHGAVNTALGMGLGAVAGKILHGMSAHTAVDFLVKNGLSKEVAEKIMKEGGVKTAHHVFEWLEHKGMVEMAAILGHYAEKKATEKPAAK